MATVDGLTKARMLAIEAESVTGARLDVVTNHLILIKHDLSEIDVGNVQGPIGPQGPPGTPLHGATVAGPANFGDAPTPGVDTTHFSMADHDHGLPNLPASVTHSLIMGWIGESNTGGAFGANNLHRFTLGGANPSSITMTRPGTLTGLSITEVVNNLVGGNPMRHYTVYRNGVATAVTVASNSNGPNTTRNFVNNGAVAFAAGDEFEILWSADAGFGGGTIDVEAGIEVAF